MNDFLKDICKLTARQREAIGFCSKYPYVLYGGIAGTGKTRVLVAAAAFFNMLYAQYGHSIIGALATKDDRRFKERFMKEVNELLVEPGFGYITGGTKDNPPAFIFHGAYAHCGQIQFISLHDTVNLRGRNLSYICIDELSDLLEEDWHDITWRVRELKTPGPFNHCPILCAANAEGIGAHWVYEYFVNKSFNTPKGENAKDQKDWFCFHPSKLTDNPDTAYVEYNIKLLQSQPEHLRRARLEGIWDSKQGARFPYEIQSINPFAIPNHWPRVVGIDHGSGKDPTFAVWMAFDEEGNCFVYREYEAREKDVFTLAKEIKALSGTERIRGYHCDPTMFRRNPVSLEGLDKFFRNEGIILNASTNEHVITNTLIEKYLHPDNGYPSLYLMRGKTEKLKQSLEAARYGTKTNNPENLEPHSITHAIYSLGYALNSRTLKATEQKVTGDFEKVVRGFEREWHKKHGIKRKRTFRLRTD